MKRKSDAMERGDSLGVLVYSSGFEANRRAKKEIGKLVRRKGND